MQILIPGALPPASLARELANHLPQRAPTLHAWMTRARAEVESLDARETGCTPAEAWELRQAGFQPEPGQRLGAGLGPLRANLLNASLTGLASAEPDEAARTGTADGPASSAQPRAPADAPVWIADLAHVALSTSHVALADPAQLAVTEPEDQALFDAVAPWLDGTGITLARVSPGRWRAGLPADMAPPSASPAAVSGDRLDDWWPQDDSVRPWRRLLNEIQMIWHDHPVNAARAEAGKPPVNSLWLYGGARPWTCPPAPGATTSALVRPELAPHAAAGDWAAWLDALAALDRDTLAPLAARGGMPRLVLAGDDRLVTLAPSRNLLPDWFPRRERNWKSWWHPPV